MRRPNPRPGSKGEWRREGCGLLRVASLWCAAAPARAEAPVLPDLRCVIDSGRLVVALMDEDVHPMVTTDAKGNLGGFDVDLARALAGLLGVKAEYRRDAGTPKIQLAAQGEIPARHLLSEQGFYDAETLIRHEGPWTFRVGDLPPE